MNNESIISSQLIAQQVLKSPNLPNAVKYYEELQKYCSDDLSELIRIYRSILPYMTEKTHLKYRRAIAKPLAMKNIERYREKVECAAKDTLASLKNQKHFDLTKDFSDRLYLELVKHCFCLDIKDEERFLQAIKYAPFITESNLSLRTVKILQNALVYIESVIIENIENGPPSEGLLYETMRATEESLSTETIQILLLSFIFALKSAPESLSNALIQFSLIPKNQREFKVTRNWIEEHLEDLIRLTGSTHILSRVINQDIDIEDAPPLKKGSIVHVNVYQANRDPTYFSAIDLESLGNEKQKKSVTFGSGAHKCPGSALAKIIYSSVIPIFFEQIETVTAQSSNQSLFESYAITNIINAYPVNVIWKSQISGISRNEK